MSKATGIICAAVCLTLLVCLPRAGSAAKGVYVTVEAGAFDRRDTVVSFALPRRMKPGEYALRDGAGRLLPLQVGLDGRATFVLAELKAGATARFRVVGARRGAAPPAGGVRLSGGRERLTLSVYGRRLLDYVKRGELPSADIKPVFRRGGYLHPVTTPSGRAVTDDYPPDHFHHHGIWFAWTKTEFEGRAPDFWNMGDGTGAVEFVALDDAWSGRVHGGFKSRHRHVDLSGRAPKVVLEEVWEVTAYGVGGGPKPYFVFDLVSTQVCAASSPLVLSEYRYGGMGFRGHRDWKGKGNAFFLTSEGKGRSDGHATRARWCHVGGHVGGRLAGLAILDHPRNFRSPQPMRIHPDDPFFNFAPPQLGKFEIIPGEPYVSRYRYVVSDGPPDAAEIERLWRDYADPPRVTVAP
jgi:hypothetical protein